MSLECFWDWGLQELRQWAADRRLPLQYERSLRLQTATAEARRALFSFPIAAAGQAASQEVLQICRAMSSPESHRQAIKRFFAAAQFVHFGFEYSGSTVIGKCYLELPAGDEGESPQTGKLQFLGFKWSMNDRSVAVLSRYKLIPGLSWQAIREHVESGVTNDVRHAVTSLLDPFAEEGIAAGNPGDRHSGGDCRLLQVEEEGSDRKSYDVNVYSRCVRVRQLAKPIRDAANQLEAPAATIENWLDQNADCIVGHIAAGIGRQQQSFLTIYHSAELGS